MKSSRVLTQWPPLYPSAKSQYPIVFRVRNPSHLSQRRSCSRRRRGARAIVAAPSARTTTGRQPPSASTITAEQGCERLPSRKQSTHCANFAQHLNPLPSPLRRRREVRPGKRALSSNSVPAPRTRLLGIFCPWSRKSATTDSPGLAAALSTESPLIADTVEFRPLATQLLPVSVRGRSGPDVR
jgi:hypothetical protein